MKIILTRAAATVSLHGFRPPPLDDGFLVGSQRELSLGRFDFVEMLDNIFQSEGGFFGRGG